MKASDDISGFGPPVEGVDINVDFSHATKLNRGGSTCETWVTTLQRRRVFIKRLRPEYRGNPLYRAAFDKEYDLGVSLNHPSLPRYVAFNGEWIALDFVEGDTLAELIERKDARLHDKRFVRHLLSQLVDVIDYLHHRHVVHCDVKADNVIVSPYADRPVTLIDLDKAYTSWLDSTAGDPAKYDCRECADGRIDFRGLGRIASRLGMKRFAEACNADDITADRLRPNRPSRYRLPDNVVVGLICVVLGVGLVCLSYLFVGKQSADRELPTREQRSADSIRADVDTMPSPPVVTSAPAPVNLMPEAPVMTGIDPEWIDRMMADKFAGLSQECARVREMMLSDSVPMQTVEESFGEYIRKSGAAKSDVIYLATTHFDRQSELEVQKAVRSHPLWERREAEDMELMNAYSDFLRIFKSTPQSQSR